MLGLVVFLVVMAMLFFWKGFRIDIYYIEEQGVDRHGEGGGNDAGEPVTEEVEAQVEEQADQQVEKQEEGQGAEIVGDPTGLQIDGEIEEHAASEIGTRAEDIVLGEFQAIDAAVEEDTIHEIRMQGDGRALGPAEAPYAQPSVAFGGNGGGNRQEQDPSEVDLMRRRFNIRGQSHGMSLAVPSEHDAHKSGAKVISKPASKLVSQSGCQLRS